MLPRLVAQRRIVERLGRVVGPEVRGVLAQRVVDRGGDAIRIAPGNCSCSALYRVNELSSTRFRLPPVANGLAYQKLIGCVPTAL